MAIKKMRALSIKQPFAEQILRGIKTFEYRTRPTHVTINENFILELLNKDFE